MVFAGRKGFCLRFLNAAQHMIHEYTLQRLIICKWFCTLCHGADY